MHSTKNNVELHVHLSGVVAYVPYGDGLWVLLPNGLSPSPAGWQLKRNPEMLSARPPHDAVVIVEAGAVDRKYTNGFISTQYQPWDPDNFEDQIFPLTASPKALIHLDGHELKFSVPAGKLHIDREVTDFVPDMKIISKKHSKVSSLLLPGSAKFDAAPLAGGLKIETGTLHVEAYFGGVKKTKLDFAHVTTSLLGRAKFTNRTWHKSVANHLLWRVPLHGRSVTMTTTKWPSKEEKATAGTKQDVREYFLFAPEGRDVIEVALLNSEIEPIVFFLGDPAFPKGIQGLPDPDFELLYTLSSFKKKRSLYRVPVPETGGKGSKEKPCTGGMFGGFENV